MSAERLASVPVPMEVLVRIVDADPDRRVISRLRTMDRRETFGFSTVETRGVCIDTETTGLDPTSDRIVELAVQTFGVDARGRIVETGRQHGWLEDPGMPLPEECKRVTRLTDADVRGRSICDGEAYAILSSAQVIVAHNAAFDRPFLERRFPELKGARWACSMSEVDWEGLGFIGRKLELLALQTGWFYKAHRATIDVTALLHLLDHVLDDGSTVLGRMLERAARPTWVVTAPDVPWGRGDALRARGWRWDRERRLWFREMSDEEVDREMEWVTTNVYHAVRVPERERVDWTTRFSRP